MIQNLLASGQRFSSGRLTIYQDSNIPGLEKDYAGAYLVPKSAGIAVHRNRIKRWLREDLRELQNERKIKGGFVIRFKGKASETIHKDLKEDLKEIYRSIKQNA